MTGRMLVPLAAVVLSAWPAAAGHLMYIGTLDKKLLVIDEDQEEIVGEIPLSGVPRATALGSLIYYITHADPRHFQPANITFDLLEPLEEEVRKKVRDKKERHRIQCDRALGAFEEWRTGIQHPAAELRT